MPYKKILADNLITFRTIEDISQEEIAFRTEISKHTIILIENQKANVRLDTLEKLACYTGLTIAELFTENFVKRNIM